MISILKFIKYTFSKSQASKVSVQKGTHCENYYIPPYFEENDNEKIIEFIKNNNFGMLISTNENMDLYCTHIPMIVCKNSQNELVIRGHFAGKNQQWKDLDNRKILAVFSGDNHSYISPRYYVSQDQVGTWNYQTVHVEGHCKLVKDYQEKVDFQMELSEFHEGGKHTPDVNNERFKMLIGGITCFEMKVEGMRAQFKLSQNKKGEDFNEIIRNLDKQTCPVTQNISKIMKQANQTEIQ